MIIRTEWGIAKSVGTFPKEKTFFTKSISVKCVKSFAATIVFILPLLRFDQSSVRNSKNLCRYRPSRKIENFYCPVKRVTISVLGTLKLATEKVLICIKHTATIVGVPEYKMSQKEQLIF